MHVLFTLFVFDWSYEVNVVHLAIDCTTSIFLICVCVFTSGTF
jgi:hypothetical protein